MFIYLIFVGALAVAGAIENVTVTKDKRQVEQPTHSFVPSNHQIGGQNHYGASGEQATQQNYYRYVQNLLQNQQQPQQYQDSPKEIPAHQNEPRHHAQPIKPSQYVYYNEPQAQYQPDVDSQHQLETKVISEEEYLELVRRQNGDNINHTAAPIQHRVNKASQYKAQKDYQQTYIPNEQPQSYLKSYVNPLGEFSLEKELAQLEKSNKAIYDEQSEKNTEQSLKRERYQFKPSHQFAEYQDQQDQFLPPEYSQLRPVSQKLISSPYERDESGAEKANSNPQEYQFRYASPSPSVGSSAKFYQDAIKTGPKNSYVSLPKPQHLDEADSAAHANIAKKHSQLIYQKQHTQSSLPQHSPPSKKQPQKINGPISEKFNQYQPNKAQSQSSIFVSQSTGIQQKPQVENEKQQQDNNQQQQQAQQLYHNHQQPQHQQPQHQQPQHQHPRLPLTNPNRPLTQEEFQALVDAGYKVQAIPIPVPVPVSAEAYAQHQQQQQHQQQSQQQQSQQQQQPQHPHHVPQHHQHPYHLQQSVNPTRGPSSVRPQPSNKHYIRYNPQPTDGVLTSYLRPFLEQYNNLMGGKA